MSLKEGFKMGDAIRTILIAGMVAGTMDITAACIQVGLRGVSPVRVLQYIASGILGPNGAKASLAPALGLAIHFFIALTAATLYFLASRKVGFLISQAILCGPLYGIVVWAVMNLIVVPLSRISRAPMTAASAITACLILIFCIGWPIALIVRWRSR